MTNRKMDVTTIPTFPPGYVAKRRGKQRAVGKERAGATRWLIRAAADDRKVVVVDALDEDEALRRAHLMSGALKSLGVWPKLPVVYAKPHGEGPVTIAWFREGMFQMLDDLQSTS